MADELKYEREFIVPQQIEDNMRWRASMLERARRDPGFAAAVKQIFYTDITFAFNGLFWAYDPRLTNDPLGADRPFILFDMQADLISRVRSAVQDGRDLILYKRSRDLGGTWCICGVALWEWLQPAGGMTWLLGSRKQDLVDTSGASDTLFFVLRYNLYRLPPWLRPEGFDRHYHDSSLKLVNPQTHSMIRGESTNENYGSGGRYRAILFDEFAKWGSLDEAAWTAAAQASPSRLALSTAKGSNNKFAELVSKRIPHDIEVLELHWQNDPRKDEDWYKRQQGRMLEEEIAQELEGSLVGSAGKRFYTEFKRSTHRCEKEIIPGVDVIVGWDFGYHHPCVVATQVDTLGRWHIQRVIMGRDVFIKEFTHYVIKRLRSWYGELARFIFYGDISGSHKSDKDPKSSVEIVHTITNIPVTYSPIIREDINAIIRRLLGELIKGEAVLGVADYSDDEILPDFIETTSTRILLEAFEGGVHFPPKDHGDIDDWEKDGYYEHSMDALGIIAWHIFRHGAKAVKISRMLHDAKAHNEHIRAQYQNLRGGNGRRGRIVRGRNPRTGRSPHAFQ